jgi:hypothetical protein
MRTQSIGLLVGLALACGCGQGSLRSFDGPPRLQLVLKNRPSDRLNTAIVRIGRAVLLDDSDPARTVELVPAHSPRTQDLMWTRGGVELVLADARVPPGRYTQLRLTVQDASVSLVDGFVFSDGVTVRQVAIPSALAAGIEVRLARPIEVRRGMRTKVTVDFDVSRSFQLRSDPLTLARVDEILFEPQIEEIDRAESPIVGT